MISITKMRSDVGLQWPNWEQKKAIWKGVESPTAMLTGGYHPGPTASRAHRSDAMGVAISGGAGAGKSLWSGMEGLTGLPFMSLIWIIAFGYRKARPEFQYLSEGAKSIGLAREADIHLPLDDDKPCSMYSIEHDSPVGPIRCQVQTITVRDYQEQLATRRPDLMIVCEPGLIDELADMEPTIWGRLAERRGRMIAAGTSEEMSEDWFRMLEEWARPDNTMGCEVYTLPTWENKRVYPLGEKEPVLASFRKRFGDELYQMRFGGKPAEPKGLVLSGYWDERLIGEFPHDPGLPTEIFIDPNYMDPARYSIGFIQWNDMTGDWYIVDEICKAGCSHPEMITLFKDHPLSKYVLGGEIDPHSGDHHPNGSMSPIEYWQDVIPDIRCGTKQIPVRTTVQSIKQSMTPRPHDLAPRLHIDRKCERMIDEGSRWKLTPQGQPKTTWCDMLKGFGYWAVRRFAEERQQSRGDDNIVRAQDYDFSGRTRGRTAAEHTYWEEYDRIYGRAV